MRARRFPPSTERVDGARPCLRLCRHLPPHHNDAPGWPMIQQKVCLIGGFAVGKTSLVSRFVHSIFSDKYHTTVGVKIDKKPVDLGERQVELVLWDIYGQDDYQALRVSYLRGAAGYLLVVDGTRPATLDTATDLCEQVRRAIGPVPFVLVLNKSDLASEWSLEEAAVLKLASADAVVRTSAKTGRGVEDAFARLARAMSREAHPRRQ